MMKKELLAVALLLAILSASLVNIWYLNKTTDELKELVNAAETNALSGNWDEAAAKAEDAAGLWHSKDPYTHMVLQHGEIDEATASIYALLEEIYAQNEGGVKGAAEGLVSQIDSLSSIEEIKFGNIF